MIVVLISMRGLVWARDRYDLPLYMAVTQQTEILQPKDEQSQEPATWIKDGKYPDIHLDRSYVGRVSDPFISINANPFYGLSG